MLKIGDILEDKYRILSEIGRGGMSHVYLALNEKANKSWAVKEVKKEGKQDFEVFQQSLTTERDILMRLKHKNLPSIIDVIERDDTFVIVMDYIEGVTIQKYLDNDVEITEEMVISWSLQLCDVLTYLHSQDPPIIYRDMKPGNIMIRPDGTVCLIDFGASREFKEGNVKDTVCIGTKGYAAPEQFAGNRYGQTDSRTDIYGLGATMYHVLTKHNPCLPPYEMYPIRHWDDQFSAGLEHIIQTCTKNNPDERYQSCAELAYALEHYEEQDLKYKQSAKRKFAVFCVSCLCCIASLFVSVWSNYKQQQIKNLNYDTFISDAVLQETISDRLVSYEQAIALDPNRPEAYQAILNMFLEDSVFVAEEDTYIRELMAKESSSGSTYEELFSSNTEEYSHFAYQMAMAYWYSYGLLQENEIQYQREYNIALRWFEKVTLTDPDNPVCVKEYNNAVVYKNIGSYYADLGQINRAGDSEVSYSTYLTDLASLYDIQDNNMITRLYLNKEIVYQIVEHAYDYQHEGLEREYLEELIQMIEEEINSIDVDEKNKVLYDELLNSIRLYIDTARNSISSAYSERGN